MPRALRTALVVIGFVLASATAFAKAPPVPPAPTRWVTDNAGLLSPDARTALDTRLETYQKTTGHQVIVWISPTLGDENLEEWSARVFTTWGIGRKGEDDGLALFVFPNDRAMRIEIGYGLEDKLTDYYAKRIITEAIAPQLAAGHNDVAIQNGVDQILARLGGDPASANVAPLPAQAPVRGGVGGLSWFWIVVLVIAGIGVVITAATHPQFAWFLFDIITSFGNGGGGSWSGGSGGGGGGGFSGGGGRSGGGGASGHW